MPDNDLGFGSPAQSSVAFYVSSWPDFAVTDWAGCDTNRVCGFGPAHFRESGFWASRIHPDDRVRVLAVIGGLSEGDEFAVEYRWRCAGEDYQTFCDIGVVVPRCADRPAQLLGTWENASMRAVAHQEARRLAAVFEASPDLVAIIGPDGSVLYLNPLGRSVFKVPPDSEIRFSLFDDLPRDVSTRIRDQCDCAKIHGFWKGEDVIGRPDEKPMAVSKVVVAHRGPSGAVEFFSLVMRDMSDLRDLEGRLAQAQKMEALGLFAGRVAHDLNNLLTVSVLCLDRLQEYIPLDAAGRSGLEELQKASQRSQTLANQLLTASLQEPTDLEDFDLGDAVREAVRMVRPVILEGIDLATSLAADPLVIHADRAQVEVSLINLILNARDAMPAGGRITISVRTGTTCLSLDQSEMASGGQIAMVSVEDTGEGISPEALPRVFEPFFSTKQKGKGIGLGLTTVYAAVKQAGGGIGIDTVPGRGTRFDLCFPMGGGPATSCSAPATVAVTKSRTSGILVVDDEEAIRDAIRHSLEDAGYAVAEAASGEEALDWLSCAEIAPSLVVTDIVMPGMNGTDLAEQVLDAWPDTRVLFISGYTGQGFSLTRFRRRGAELLRKPFEPEDLLKAVSVVMNRRLP